MDFVSFSCLYSKHVTEAMPSGDQVTGWIDSRLPLLQRKVHLPDIRRKRFALPARGVAAKPGAKQLRPVLSQTIPDKSLGAYPLDGAPTDAYWAGIRQRRMKQPGLIGHRSLGAGIDTILRLIIFARDADQDQARQGDTYWIVAAFEPERGALRLPVFNHHAHWASGNHTQRRWGQHSGVERDSGRQRSRQ